MSSPSHSSTSSSDKPNIAVDATIQAVNWDVILHTARDKVGANTARWGQQKSGGYNLIRFLHLDDDQVVVRLPLYPHPERSGHMTPELMHRNVRKMASMIASMEYVATHTHIPVPRVIHACLDPDLGNVRSPYVVMSKMEGMPLSSYWDDMPDAKRDIVLAQVIDILLELSTLRFDKIGSLFKTSDGGWRIEPSPGDDDTPDLQATYTSGTDEYIALANARLDHIEHGRFGYIGNEIDYTRYWFMRSLIPSLYDNTLDANGFLLMHGDFHSQNIFVADVETHPHITAIIDWDDTATVSTSSFAQHPFFIVDHPAWDDEEPLRPRNVRDQAVFNRLLEQAERAKFPDTAPALSRAFANCKGIYAFEQCMRFEYIYHLLFWELVQHAFGPGAEEKGWNEYTDALERGVLKDVVARLAAEADVMDEAKEVLGHEVSLEGMRKKAFVEVARKYSSQLPPQGKVMKWLDNTVAAGGMDH